MAQRYLDTSVAYLKGVGPQKADVFQKELGIVKYSDLLAYFPFRYIDRTHIDKIIECREPGKYVQLKGKVIRPELIKAKGNRQRLKAWFEDDSGSIELVWFSGVKWIQNLLHPNTTYLLLGRLSEFNGVYTISHPELEVISSDSVVKKGLEPVYGTTEKSKLAGVNSRFIYKCIVHLWASYSGTIAENLPEIIISKLGFPTREEAIRNIHLPPDKFSMEKARTRLKFEELFFAQIRILQRRVENEQIVEGILLKKPETPGLLSVFFHSHMPFGLTKAQTRVLSEIRKDLSSGKQMNRLLQGDVGSGKTIVAFIAMLMAIEQGYQCCLLAPTEILANQHYLGLKEFADKISVEIDLLTGSSSKLKRKTISEGLESGSLKILVGTHAILEDKVVFFKLGMAVVDEQHRFGVVQRAKLWAKGRVGAPHILVMTATPIPRTLSMTLYGDLDISVIDELPPGRKPVYTVHRREGSRSWVYEMIHNELRKGRQAYVVFPLIEGSEKLDYRDLTEGYDWIVAAFPQYKVGFLHGQMKAKDKDKVMASFVGGDLHILVSTTVIEVGVNVPNASLMLIESAERFGLSQLHQLRGRVGRGADQSYCYLLTGNELSSLAIERMQVMCETNDGFRIAEKDLELRGPGDIEGTKQSGDVQYRIANLATDAHLLMLSRDWAKYILSIDSNLLLEEHKSLKKYLERRAERFDNWSQIS